MAFILESTLDGAGTIVKQAYMTDSEASTSGEALVFSSGRLTKCGTTGKPQAIAAQTATAGTDVEISYIPVRRDQVFLADYTGTAPTVGVKTYALDSTGLKVDGDTASGGCVEILSVDSVNGKCRVKFDL